MSDRSRLDRRRSTAPRAVRRAPAAPTATPAPARTRRAPTPTTTPAVPARGPAGPVVKWVGGKTRLLPELARRVPAHFTRYYEPFAGGAALFFHLAPARAVLADCNRDLIGLYTALATDVPGIVRRLELHRGHHDEAYYYETRARWNDASVSWTPVDRAATFIYLNKTCYNGLWRVNRSGGFNVPMGRYKDPSIFDPDALAAAGIALAAAELRVGDYRAAVADAGAGDFVYFDPPYDPVTQTANFTSYTAGSFSSDDQRGLADLARELVGRGCRVMLSNSDTPFIRSLYRGDFRLDQVRCPRHINSNAARRGDVDELVIVGGY